LSKSPVWRRLQKRKGASDFSSGILKLVIGSITKRKDGHFNLNTYEYCPKAGKKRTHTRYLAAADRPGLEKFNRRGGPFLPPYGNVHAELILAKTRRECLVLSISKRNARRRAGATDQGKGRQDRRRLGAIACFNSAKPPPRLM
jgi:hypothetical protein